MVNQIDTIKFLKQGIIYRFGFLETITCDNGTVYSKEHRITIIHSTPYYAQGNGQAEASNKVLKANLAKVINDNPATWAKLLSKVLWAFRTTKRTGTTPFSLAFGYDQVFPMEVTVRSLQVTHQHNLTAQEYSEAMMTELEDLCEECVKALDFMQAQKMLVAKAYDNRVRPKEFQKG
ncbi:uncharacterized protein LOC122092327 [Macadamia integrifolia]|uniref:uncharacterized protein LOC122092327 n=1 Tax=Macadamia integrifolia TaxID=60698 RepID=UPI001C532F34|nr:uncharacterized protein LOC122092327 [Macadamia integrifolia]